MSTYDKNRNPTFDYEPREFPYKSLKEPRYIKDKNDFFRENGNGWWWGKTSHQRKTNFTRTNRRKK